MNEAILIGTYGWDYGDWSPDFYPAELPADWRFCYFSNRLRSVIVPATAWTGLAPAAASQWVEDSDPGFRLVLELPAALVESEAPAAAAERFFAQVAPVRDLTAALLAPVAPTIPPTRLDRLLAVLRPRHPVCVRPDAAIPVAVIPEDLRACVRAHGASICWSVDREPEPEPEGEFLVALMEKGEPRSLRAVLERLAQWQAGARGAGLYFPSPPPAEAARLLAELMGV